MKPFIRPPVKPFIESSIKSRDENAQAVMARSGRTFHLASRLLPMRMRADAAELYAFCRRMDDLADEEEPKTVLDNSKQLASTVEALLNDPTGAQAAELGWPVALEERFSGIAKIAALLTEALANDTGQRRIADEDLLLQYAFGVAGTVGLMMCRILGAPPAGARAAVHLGIAMQLTNIARDVREDFNRDRIYLPATWITAPQVRLAFTEGTQEPLRAATRRLVALADEFYRSADAGMHYLPWSARVSILSAAACYRAIGLRVARDVPSSWARRIVVPSHIKISLVALAFARSLTASHFLRPTTSSTNRHLSPGIADQP